MRPVPQRGTNGGHVNRAVPIAGQIGADSLANNDGTAHQFDRVAADFIADVLACPVLALWQMLPGIIRKFALDVDDQVLVRHVHRQPEGQVSVECFCSGDPGQIKLILHEEARGGPVGFAALKRAVKGPVYRPAKELR